MTPKNYQQNLHTPKNINFSENPQKYWNSEFWTQKNGPSLRMCENIRVPPPGGERWLTSIWNPSVYTMDHENAIGLNRY